jgi:hypothetical protein
MPVWMSALLFGVGGLIVGATVTIAALRIYRAAAFSPPRESADSGTDPSTEAASAGAEPDPPRHVLALIEPALRRPLMHLRRSESFPSELMEPFERIAWQMRMLLTTARPMQAKPTSPISLLQEAAEEVTLLRLGKVPASWSLRNRQPVHVDEKRARAGFRELLRSAADIAGEGNRIAIRIGPGAETRFPVLVEVEIGRRGAEPDDLAFLVARHLLESQGARVERDGPVVRVALRCAAPEPASVAQTPSNR